MIIARCGQVTCCVSIDLKNQKYTSTLLQGVFVYLFSKLILRISRYDWPSCLKSECYSTSAAVIVDDDNYACKDSDKDMTNRNCFRPSYSLADLKYAKESKIILIVQCVSII